MSNCRLEQHRADGTLIGYICRKNNRLCTDEECQQCPDKTNIAAPQWSQPPQKLEPPPRPRPMRGAPSPLAHIADTLSPAQEGRDRPMTVDVDGTITYTKQSDDEEPPKDISGYERNPDNPWQFFSLWMPCDLRTQTGIRFANCGCIDIVMRCNNPAIPVFGRRVGHVQCSLCRARKTLET